MQPRWFHPVVGRASAARVCNVQCTEFELPDLAVVGVLLCLVLYCSSVSLSLTPTNPCPTAVNTELLGLVSDLYVPPVSARTRYLI